MRLGRRSYEIEDLHTKGTTNNGKTDKKHDEETKSNETGE
jgi:hypothetical protein